mgnify:CR=1 FL=1
MKRKKNTVRPIQKMTELNEVIEEGGLHSTGKCKSYGEDGGFIARKRPQQGEVELESRGVRSGGFILWRLAFLSRLSNHFHLSRVPGTIQVAR